MPYLFVIVCYTDTQMIISPPPESLKCIMSLKLYLLCWNSISEDRGNKLRGEMRCTYNYLFVVVARFAIDGLLITSVFGSESYGEISPFALKIVWPDNVLWFKTKVWNKCYSILRMPSKLVNITVPICLMFACVDSTCRVLCYIA